MRSLQREPRRPETDGQGSNEIIGAYEIADIVDENNLIATSDHRIRLTKQQAELLPFWRHYKNKDGGGGPAWKTGLFRYLEDEQVHTILGDMSAVCGASQAGEDARKLLQRHFGQAPTPPRQGAINEPDPAKRAALARKYPGGEGKDHKQLKLWIAETPASIGLPKKSVDHIEHSFDSGDCVDILFELPGALLVGP